MKRLILIVGVVSLGSWQAACGGGKKTECGPLEVTVDGKPVTGLTHGYAITHKRAGELTQQVEVFNHEAKCEELVSRKGRSVPDGEQAVRAFTGGSGMMGQGVGIESHTQMGVDVALMGEAPKNPGDKVALCVSDASFKPAIGDYKDKAVVVKGKLEGTYCGVMDWDAE
ncbi:MAG: hypothetical protein IT385_11405 [Deltaproteobacteria bacterium]|nr:hypothetical protein [Deltaproteobacteria bacterium]